MDTMHLQDPLVLFGYEGSALSLLLFLLSHVLPLFFNNGKQPPYENINMLEHMLEGPPKVVVHNIQVMLQLTTCVMMNGNIEIGKLFAFFHNFSEHVNEHVKEGAPQLSGGLRYRQVLFG